MSQSAADQELIFYTNPMSRGRIVRWMLEETGRPYRTELIPFGAAMSGPEFRAVNPMGKVPAIRHGGQVVTESAAICAYLAEAFPEAGLAPQPAERASYYRWMFFVAGPLEAATTNHVLGFEPTAEQHRMVGYGSYAETIDTLEKAMPAKNFLTGPRFTAADVYVGAHVGWGLFTGSIDKRPAFADYFARVSDRDAWRRAREIDDSLMPKQQASA